MADLDRGAYTPPTDGGLAFDPRAQHRRRPLPITLILSVTVLLVLIGALVFLYRAGVNGESGAPETVGEPVGPVREAPAADAQPVDPATGLEVYTDEAEPQAPVFTPPPEQPVARPTAPVQSRPAPPPTPTGTTGLADPAPAVQPAPPTVRPAPPATTPPAARPAPAPAAPAPARPAAPVPAAPAPQPTQAAPPPTTSIGSVSAQIGAFNTRAQAQAALARQPGGAGQRIEEVQRNGQTLYRAIATGFPDRAAAQSYCAGVSGGCIIR